VIIKADKIKKQFMETIEKYLEESGFRFYDDEAFDYYYKDCILFYKESEDSWGAQIENGCELVDVRATAIKTVESAKAAFEMLKTKVDWKKIEALQEFIKKQNQK